ncbi:MAG: aspartate aminotransferase family protein [Clostridia bacterium]|nr:aspartate aminotransferase family protein [Clostridia bacterium]
MYSEYILNTYKRNELLLKKGHGSWLMDHLDNEYLDMVAGIAVNSLGYSHPKLVAVMKEQSELLWHVSNLYWTKEQGVLAEKLIELSDHSKVFFCNSGTEAVEGALKTAKKYGQNINVQKKKVICFNHSFHGRTLGALSVTAQEKYLKSFGVNTEDVIVCEFNNLEEVTSKISDEICGIIVEPVQGEGGIYPGTQGFLSGLKTLADSNDILLIFDEVQCGIGRMGTFFAYEHFNVVPDVVCMAKGLGGGVPIGAFLVNKKAEVLTYGDHGSTFGGNPLICSLSKAVVDEISKKEFLKEVKLKSKKLKEGLLILKEKNNLIREVRGEGLMIGIELKTKASEVVEAGLKNNLLLISAGEYVLRLVPPLIIKEQEIELFLNKFEDILKQL